MKKKKITKWKIPNIVFLVFMIIILVLYGQYIYLSLSKSVYGINMNEFAKNRNTVTKEKIAERGKIFDVNGEVLALNVTSYTLIAYLDDSREYESCFDFVKWFNEAEGYPFDIRPFRKI